MELAQRYDANEAARPALFRRVWAEAWVIEHGKYPDFDSAVAAVDASLKESVRLGDAYLSACQREGIATAEAAK